MNTGGEAAEQIVRMSLEGFEVAAKITGAGAKNIAILLYSILKEEKKTKGKARLTSMLRSGKELKVFTVKSGDLKKFTQEAKKYGVLYCVLTDRRASPTMPKWFMIFPKPRQKTGSRNRSRNPCVSLCRL